MNRNYISAVSNNRGHMLEKLIENGCKYYAEKGEAFITKVPEPFKVIRLDRQKHRALIRFTAHAQPDFMGTIRGGQSIVFEAKSTITDRLKVDCVTEAQWEALEEHYKKGAVVGVCAEIKEDFYFVPWEIFKNAKTLFGHKYIKCEDIEKYKVKYNHGSGGLMFLENEKRSDFE